MKRKIMKLVKLKEKEKKKKKKKKEKKSRTSYGQYFSIRNMFRLMHTVDTVLILYKRRKMNWVN